MKKIFITTTILLFILVYAYSQENRSVGPTVIDIELGLNNLSRMKVSDFGKKIRYIPLETTDESIVGKSPVVKVLKNFIVVEYKSHTSDPGVCLLFNKEDGRFISKIGHEGQDPAAYSDCFSWTDEKEEFLYFQRKPNQLIKYDMKGKFCDKVAFSTSELASYYVITDSQIVGFFDEQRSPLIQYSLGFFDKDGSLKDTVSSFFPYTTPFTKDFYQISILRGNTLYNNLGSWARAGAFIFTYNSLEQIRQISVIHAARIWKINESIRYKQDYIDTIFTVSGNKLIPSIVFKTGKYHWPANERRSEKNNSARIFIADIYENNDFIFFQCTQGMYNVARANGCVLYNGLYNKKTRETKLSKNGNGIEDDLSRFISFKPLGMSTSGEFVSLVESWEIIDWFEKHPEAKNNKNLSFLKQLDIEMNPTVILIE